jgi:3-deoxy-D-manno-octulosonic-acid transferase
LIRARLGPLRSSRNPSTERAGPTTCILVDETGVLSELYASADWAYIGGGFGDGVHSTIEPALHGIPISCGPGGAEKFAEIEDLKQSGQLSMVRSTEELASWLKEKSRDATPRGRWIQDARARLGATGRILELLLRSC